MKKATLLLTLLALTSSLARAGAAADTITIPAGTVINVRLNTTLSTRTNKNGDPFTGRVMDPVFVKGEEAIPAGSSLDGHVTYVREPGRATGAAEIRLVADHITTPDGNQYTIVAGLEDEKGAPGAKVSDKEGTVKGPGKSKKSQVEEAGAGAGAGAAVGAIAAGGTGALYGAGIGAIAAAVHSIAKHHKDLVLPVGTELTFEINRDTTAKKAEKSADQPPFNQ